MRSLPFNLTLLAATLAAGCTLIDQRSFNPQAGIRPQLPAAPAPKASGPAALLTIRYTTPDPAYADELATAVKHALAIKPNVYFTIQTHMPFTGSYESQQAALTEAAASGREIAESIIADGADQGQVEQTVQIDPAVKVREVRIFVH